MPNLIAEMNPLEHVLPHWLHLRVGPFELTNQMLMAAVAAVLMLLIFPVLFRRRYAEPSPGQPVAPRGSTNFFESILEFLRVEVFRPALKEHTDRFLPFLWTLFFFILFCNLLGQIPIGDIITLLTGKESHIGGTATGAITTTFALAICTFIFIHLNGIVQVARSLMDGTYGHHGHHEEHSAEGVPPHEAAHDLDHMRGESLPAEVPADFKAVGDPTKHYGDDEYLKHHHQVPDRGDLHGAVAHGNKTNPVLAILLAVPLYLWNFAPHPFKPEPGASAKGWLADIPIFCLLLLLELVGALIKPFALMIRLFANMIAGHIVLASLIGLILLVPSTIGQIGVGIPVIVLSLLIRLLELFVAFLQAYIFTNDPRP
jgi:F0F1-type ATP synthase membrane subunit a